MAFRCPSCGRETSTGLGEPAACRACGALTTLDFSPSVREERLIDVCPACRGTLFYVQRDFNQKAGLGVVAVGAALAPFTPYYSSLFAAALLDALLYLLLPEITVCYRCQAHFRGFRRNPSHQAFDLHLAEQYETPPDGR